MASILTDLPTELLDMVVSYGLDLLDFGALLFTSKEVKIKFSNVVLQQLFLDNTSLRLRGATTGANIRTGFMDSLARKCIRSNNPTGIEVCFGKNRISSSISSLFFNSSGQFALTNRLNYIKEIFDNDADMVLSYILQYFLDNIPAKGDRSKEVIALLSPLSEGFIQFRQRNYEQHLQQVLSNKKTYFVVLEFFRKEFSTVFGWLADERNFYFKIEESPADAIFMSFDKFQNLNEILVDVGMAGDKLKSGDKVTALEYTCLTGSLRIFDMILQHGAIFDKSKAYLPLFLIGNKFGNIQFLELLVQMGASFNVPLPSTIFNDEIFSTIGETTSILNYLACKASEESHMQLIEYVVSKGGKLLPHELEANLKEAKNSARYLVAKASQIDGYHSLRRTADLELLEANLRGRRALFFRDHKEFALFTFSLKLKMDQVENQKRFKFSLDSGYKGLCSIEDNFLICKSDRKNADFYVKKKVRNHDKANPANDVFKYRVIRTCFDQLAIFQDFDDKLSDERLFSKMIFSVHNELD